jgi:hypothetical protein
MKKSELVVGEAYAVGGTSGYDRGRLKRAVVVELDGTRTVPGRWSSTRELKGIVVRFDRGPASSYFLGYGDSAALVDGGPEAVLGSARFVHCLWEPYARQLAAEETAKQLRAKERERALAACIGGREALERLLVPSRLDQNGTPTLVLDASACGLLAEVLKGVRVEVAR